MEVLCRREVRQADVYFFQFGCLFIFTSYFILDHLGTIHAALHPIVPLTNGQGYRRSLFWSCLETFAYSTCGRNVSRCADFICSYWWKVLLPMLPIVHQFLLEVTVLCEMAAECVCCQSTFFGLEI